MHPQQTLWRRTAAAFALAFLVAGNCSAQGLVVWFDNGRVTVLAEQVSVRQILMEWSRIGSVSLENADRLPSAPIVVHLVNLPERAALETLLRGVNGYILGSRPSARTTDTAIDRIWITVPGRPAPSTLLANAASTNRISAMRMSRRLVVNLMRTLLEVPLLGHAAVAGTS